MKYGQTDPSAAKHPLVGYGWLGGDQLYSVIVSVFGARLALFSISSKLPEYLPWTLVQVNAHHHHYQL
ncbi:hypothetical protein HETIRDRAFT_328602 [Heterobasidion irregulare TC 32-1]|uniref:Uncharacterized protein n=1 Tax=Heterobasidion irregulare (strain TC 32-1) TaxID=747525 RepID=W4JSP9_HETIT|nr:uncharacterized protein HETIRDRAFT_328602 [Heterobasidion irregulare TC 32-1]ETW76568.1 hypothetical protein HETIRDRAFT_328602 [Heterobasidion irregulare TC 32-1]